MPSDRSLPRPKLYSQLGSRYQPNSQSTAFGFLNPLLSTFIHGLSKYNIAVTCEPLSLAKMSSS